MQKVSQDELAWRGKASWKDLYLHDMNSKRGKEIPEEWHQMASHHLKDCSQKVEKITLLDWNISEIDEEHRLVVNPDLWCSAVIDGQPYHILLSFDGSGVHTEFYPTEDGIEAPWK